jgi:hypothetical protein
MNGAVTDLIIVLGTIAVFACGYMMGTYNQRDEDEARAAIRRRNQIALRQAARNTNQQGGNK